MNGRKQGICTNIIIPKNHQRITDKMKPLERRVELIREMYSGYKKRTSVSSANMYLSSFTHCYYQPIPALLLTHFLPRFSSSFYSLSYIQDSSSHYTAASIY